MLLDTCALLWLAEGGGQLSSDALRSIDAAPLVHISAITGFEIGLKTDRRKLTLPVPTREWLDEIVSHHDLSVVPLTLDVCVAATELPPIHRDPCDRFIIATAKLNAWPVVTADAIFRDYGINVIV